jgi:hypothetical protein
MRRLWREDAGFVSRWRQRAVQYGARITAFVIFCCTINCCQKIASSN